MDNTRILDRIKKCLALSESPEPHEAAAAMRQAQKLMEIHGISLAQVKMADIGEAQVKSKVSVSKPKDYEVALVVNVAKAFGCKVLWTKSNSYNVNVFGSYTIIGLKSQIELASYTCDVMMRKLVKARAAFTNALPSQMYRTKKTVEADGFCKGWVSTIKKTVVEFAHPEATQSLIDDYQKAVTEGREAKVQQRVAGQNGYLAGKEAASKESIHRPVNGAAKTLQISAK